MRLVTQSVQKQHIQAAQHLHGRFRYAAVIRQIRRLPEAESVDRAVAVHHRHRRELQPVHIHAGPIEHPRLDLRNVGLPLGLSKM